MTDPIINIIPIHVEIMVEFIVIPNIVNMG